jgi:hypothetical protein
VYALSEAGRARFGRFPTVTADDGFVRLQFRPDERITLMDHVSIVRAPKTLGELIKIKTRSHFGTAELKKLYPNLMENLAHDNARGLLHLVINPLRWPAVVAYMAVKVAARWRSKRQMASRRPLKWERDDSSRRAA